MRERSDRRRRSRDTGRMVRIGVALVCLVATASCTRIGVCYSEGGMTRGEARELAIYTEALFQPLPSGEVAAVDLGPGSILAARVEPCKEHTLERIPPEQVISVTFEPASLARYERHRFDNDLIVIDFTALAEGDGEIIVRAVFDGDEVEDRRAFRVRALGDVFYQPVKLSGGSELDGPFVAGAELAAFVYPTTVTGEPLVARPPGPGWVRGDGLLAIADYPWPSTTDVGVEFPVAGMIPIRRGTSADWSWERTVPQTIVEVVAPASIMNASLVESSIPATAAGCALEQGFIAGTQLTDAMGRTIHGGAALVVASDPTALEIHLGEDPDDLFVRCKKSGDYQLALPLANAAPLLVHVP
jgi:hypothetical protein